MKDQFLFSLRKINFMKYIVVLFCLISSMSFAQKEIYSLRATLNLEVGSLQVDNNPTLNLDVFISSDVISVMEKGGMYDLPIVIMVSSEGNIQSIYVSANPSFKSFISADLKKLNKSLQKVVGLNIVSAPALKGGEIVGFISTIVLNKQQNTLIINPILHD